MNISKRKRIFVIKNGEVKDELRIGEEMIAFDCADKYANEIDAVSVEVVEQTIIVESKALINYKIALGKIEMTDFRHSQTL